MRLTLNGQDIDVDNYAKFHRSRIARTLDLVRRLGGGAVAELGGYPWAMTGLLLREPGVRLVATVSAEEISLWPDAIPLHKTTCTLSIDGAAPKEFTNYSANLERSTFDLDVAPDLVLACEIIEHMTRAPHRLLLNANRWLAIGGRLVLTTPNGSQLENPLRRRPKMPAYRASSHSRHNYVFTMRGLTDLVETCGFEIVEADYWSPYRRQGGSDLYRHLSASRLPYLRDKFAQTLCVVARKAEDRQTARRLPSVYAADAGWELVDGAPTR